MENEIVNDTQKKSNKKLIIIIGSIILVLIVVCLCLWLFVFNKQNDNKNSVQNNTTKNINVTLENTTIDTDNETEDTNTDTDSFEDLEAAIKERENALYESINTSNIEDIKTAVNTSKGVLLILSWNGGINDEAENRYVNFNEEASKTAGYEYYYGDLFYTIVSNNLNYTYDEITSDEINNAKELAILNGYYYGEDDVANATVLNALGKINEQTLIDSYDKLFLSNNYVHHDIIFVPGCKYLIYSNTYNTYYIYQNNAACEGGGLRTLFEVTNIKENNNTLTLDIAIISYSQTITNYSVYLEKEDNIYKLVSYKIN